MTNSHDLLSEDFDAFDWDANDIRDLIQTTPLKFDDDDRPFGYDAEQLFGLEADSLASVLL